MADLMRYTITDFIPQRPPFVMIDDIIHVDEKQIATSFKIDEKNFFVDQGIFVPGGIIENIAQSAAFYAGYKWKNRGQDIPMGFIASVKRVEIVKLPLVGDKLETTVEFINDMMDIHILEGKVKDQYSKEVAHCEIRIFIQNNDSHASE